MKKQYKIFGLILALALLVCSVVALSASAEDSLAIEYANVAYNKMTQLAFTIKGTPAEGAEVGLAYWGYDVTGEKTLANATVSFEKGNLDDKTYWLTPGIPASVMSEKVTVAPVTKDADGKVALAGALFEYSIYDYVKDRLVDDNVTDKQMKLYTNLVKYGNSAEKVINGDVNMPYFVAENGEISATGKGLAFPTEGDKLILRANLTNTDGEYFLNWTAPDGSKIYDRVFAVSAGATNAAYVANYGDKADSAYSASIDFNAYEAGSLSLVDLASGTIQNKSNIYYVKGSSAHFNGHLTTATHVQVAGADDKTVLKADTLDIKTDNGQNYVAYSKNTVISGVTYSDLTFYNKDNTTADRLDFEFAVTAKNGLGMDLFISFGDGAKYGRIRIYVNYDSAGNIAFYDYVNGTQVCPRSLGVIPRGEKIHITAEMCDNNHVKVYANGKLLTATDSDGNPIDTFTLIEGAPDVSKSYITKVFIAPHSGYSTSYNVYQVNFVDTDKFN